MLDLWKSPTSHPALNKNDFSSLDILHEFFGSDFRSRATSVAAWALELATGTLVVLRIVAAAPVSSLLQQIIPFVEREGVVLAVTQDSRLSSLICLCRVTALSTCAD